MPALWTTIPSFWKRHTSKKYRQAVKEAKRRKPIRNVSARLAKAKRAYNSRVKEWLKEPKHYSCQVAARRFDTFVRATQCHHQRGRRGVLLMDERYWIPVSDAGHRWIHNNPAEARKLGLLCEVGDWNKPGPIEVKPENCLVTAKSLLEKMKT